MIPHCTAVRLASFLSGGFTTMAVINPPERKLAKRISVQWYVGIFQKSFQLIFRLSLAQNQLKSITKSATIKNVQIFVIIFYNLNPQLQLQTF